MTEPATRKIRILIGCRIEKAATVAKGMLRIHQHSRVWRDEDDEKQLVRCDELRVVPIDEGQTLVRRGHATACPTELVHGAPGTVHEVEAGIARLLVAQRQAEWAD